MINYSVILQRFNSEFRNGSTFATAPTTDYTVDLKANVGELVKLTQTIEISVSVNVSQTLTIKYNATGDATYGELVGTGINWMLEGLFTGAVINLFWGGNAGISTTVGLITGTGFNTLKVTKASLITAGIIDGDIRVDFVSKLTSVPDTLIYKYGLNPNGSTVTNYTSWLDGNTQAYYLTNLTGALQTMSLVGMGIVSWNMSDSVQAKFDATVSTYFNQYTVEHIFRVPYYIDGEYSNIDDGTAPAKFFGTASITYDNGWFFGGTILGEYIKAELKGGVGSVGYFNESYNGQANNYLVQNVLISNSDNSGVLEGSVVNTVTFQLKKTTGSWTAGSSKVILSHSKLPTAIEYSNKPTIYNTLWMFERLVQVEGVAPINGTILTNYEVDINADTTLLDVTVDVQYTVTQQLLISNDTDYLLFVTIGGRPVLDPDDRISLKVDLNQFSKNLDVSGLITSATTVYYEPFEFDSGVRSMDTITGWNGDLMGTKCTVNRSTTIDSYIREAEFKIIASNGTIAEDFELLSIPIYLGKPNLVDVGGESYQILNIDTPSAFNLPLTSNLNKLRASSVVPGAPAGTQVYTFALGFQIPWREWVSNLDVPNIFYNNSEDQNNQNYRTSNYSNVNSYEIFSCWDFTVVSPTNVETVYRKMSLESNIYDFDTNSASFTGVNTYYDEDGNVTQNIYTDQNVLIKIEFPHTLGVISKTNLEAYIWIERDNSVVQPWFFHSTLNFTSPLNPLTFSNEVTSTNYSLVEINSINNLVTIFCKTNRDNLQDGVTYNIYGRIKLKTLA